MGIKFATPTSGALSYTGTLGLSYPYWRLSYVSGDAQQLSTTLTAVSQGSSTTDNYDALLIEGGSTTSAPKVASRHPGEINGIASASTLSASALSLVLTVYVSSSVRKIYVNSSTATSSTYEIGNDVTLFDRIVIGGTGFNGNAVAGNFAGEVHEVWWGLGDPITADIDKLVAKTMRPEYLAGRIDGFTLKNNSDLKSFTRSRTLVQTGTVANNTITAPITRLGGNNVLYASNFTSSTLGALPPAFAVDTYATPMQVVDNTTFKVPSINGSVNALGSNNQSASAKYTERGLMTAQDYTIRLDTAFINSSGQFFCTIPAFCVPLTDDYGYWNFAQLDGTTGELQLNTLKRYVGLMNTNYTSTGIFPTASQPYSVECNIHYGSGTVTLETRIWLYGTARPSTPTYTVTDTSNVFSGFYPTIFYSTSQFGYLGGCTNVVIAEGLGAQTIFDPVADTTAPTLTNPTGSGTGTTTANAGVTTDEANGNLYCITSLNTTETAPTLIANGTIQAVTSAGTKTFSRTGLVANTSGYRNHFVHKDAAGNVSAVVSSPTFSTSASGDTTPPVISSPTGTKTGSTTATGSVTTNEANGLMYRYTSTNATENAATITTNGVSLAVTAIGLVNFNIAALTAATTYYNHFVHVDSSGNVSNVVNSAAFTTDASVTGHLVIPRFTNNTGTNVYANLTNVSVSVQTNAFPPTVLLTLTGKATDSNGALAQIDSSALTPGSTVRAIWLTDTGKSGSGLYVVS